MKIITAYTSKGTKDYPALAANLTETCFKHGYEFVAIKAHDDERSVADFKGIQFNVFKQKADYILDSISAFNDSILWLDSDMLVAGKFDDVLGDCDAAFTLRNPGERALGLDPIFDGYLNTGFAYFANNEKAKFLLDQWSDYVDGFVCDQDALNSLLLLDNRLDSCGTFNIFGAKVKILPCDIYNCFHPRIFDKAKILHFKDDETMRHYDKCLEKIRGAA